MSHNAQIEKLVYMANQIATFFASYPEDEAIAAIADHIDKFWDPRMRRQIAASLKTGDGEMGSARLLPRARAAMSRITLPITIA
ncbi:formate dehydrogenase subunit delta [Acidiphilium sp.]|uniref:formate dehydrogenase subunit delta n=1 Tax=Acidiphilium sp. TaxID=527 RepID=UPI003D034AFA